MVCNMSLISNVFTLISTFLIVLTSSEAFEKCQPSEVSTPYRARVSPGSSPMYACDVCFHKTCSRDECAAEVHILAVQNESDREVKVDTDILRNATETLDVILVLLCKNPVTWKINLKTEDIKLHHVYATGGATVEFRNKYDQPLNENEKPIVAKMKGLAYDGTNISSIYNMDAMSDRCILSFTGVELVEKITLSVGIISPGNSGSGAQDDENQQHQQNLEEVKEVTDLVLLVGAITGGSLVFVCLVGMLFVVFRNQEKKKHTRKSEQKSDERSSDSPPPRYSQAIKELKIIPPPPSTPLPLAPGENIYSELGEKPDVTGGEYLEPVKVRESINEKPVQDVYEGLAETNNGDAYQELRKDNPRTNGREDYEQLKDNVKASSYQQLGGSPGKGLTDHSKETPTERNGNGNDTDENGYLKCS